MKGQPLKVSLPGSFYQRGQRWWWRVKLPGEDKPRARALKPEGQKATTKDRHIAAQIAFALWEQAVREDVRKQITVDSDEKMATLETKLLQEIHAISQAVERLCGKDKIRVSEEATASAQPTASSHDAEETGTCGCCGSLDVPSTALQAIDSGQMLCPKCLAELRETARAAKLGEKRPGRLEREGQ